MAVLDVDAFQKTPLNRDPFEYVIVPGFLKREAKPSLDADYPQVSQPGSFPVTERPCGPAFGAFLKELQGPEFEAVVSEKFGIDSGLYE